jgi:hypothetical protein
MKTGSRVPGEGFRGEGVGCLSRKKVKTHQGFMESPHRTAGRSGSGSHHCLLKLLLKLSPWPRPPGRNFITLTSGLTNP